MTIKKTRKGTSLHALIELVIDNPGSNCNELCNMLEAVGINWQSASVAVNLAWQIPRKGYDVIREPQDGQICYWITNADSVV